jgi:hypothetical protein
MAHVGMLSMVLTVAVRKQCSHSVQEKTQGFMYVGSSLEKDLPQFSKVHTCCVIPLLHCGILLLLPIIDQNTDIKYVESHLSHKGTHTYTSLWSRIVFLKPFFTKSQCQIFNNSISWGNKNGKVWTCWSIFIHLSIQKRKTTSPYHVRVRALVLYFYTPTNDSLKS